MTTSTTSLEASVRTASFKLVCASFSIKGPSAAWDNSRPTLVRPAPQAHGSGPSPKLPSIYLVSAPTTYPAGTYSDINMIALGSSVLVLRVTPIASILQATPCPVAAASREALMSSSVAAHVNSFPFAVGSFRICPECSGAEVSPFSTMVIGSPSVLRLIPLIRPLVDALAPVGKELFSSWAIPSGRGFTFSFFSF